MDQFDRQLEMMLTQAPGDPWDELVLSFTYGLHIYGSEEGTIEGRTIRWIDTPHNLSKKMEGAIYDRYPTTNCPTDDERKRKVLAALRDLQTRLLRMGFVIEATKLSKWVAYYEREG